VDICGKIELNARGHYDHSQRKDNVSCLLFYAGDKLPAPASTATIVCTGCENKSDFIDFKNQENLGWKDFCTRQTLTLDCECRSLVIEAEIWIVPEKN